MALDIAWSLRAVRFGTGLTLAALSAGCEDATPTETTQDASTAMAQDAFAADVILASDGAAPTISDARIANDLDVDDASVAPRGDAGDGATQLDTSVDLADARAAIHDASDTARDASIDDAQTDAAQADAAQADAAPEAPACKADVCCMPLTKAEGSATCPKEACMPQGQALRVTGVAGEKARLRCFGASDSALRYNGSDGELSLNLDPQHCSPSTGDVRAAAQGTYAVAHAVDARNGDELLAMVNLQPGFVKELTVRDGRVRVVVEGPVVSSTSAAEISFDCTRGGTLPFGICNCFFVGAGPVATITYDLPY